MRAMHCPKCKTKRDFVFRSQIKGSIQVTFEECDKCMERVSVKKRRLTPAEEEIANTKHFKEEKVRKQVRKGLW